MPLKGFLLNRAEGGAGCVTRALGAAAVFGALAALMVGPAAAEEWEFTPRLNMHATYTDNVGLQPEGQERGDWIGQINPGFSLSRTARRLDANFDYSMRNRFYLNEDDRNHISHRILGNGTFEAIRNRFFIDGGIIRREQVPSLLDPAGIQPEVGARTADTTQYTVSPHLIQPMGRFATASARYRFDERRYHGGGLDDNRSHQYLAQLDSGRTFQRFFWRLNYSHEDVEYLEGDRTDVSFTEYSGTLGRYLTRRFRIWGTVGEERNDFPTFRDDIDGPFWHAGLGWNPSERTSIEATYGERFWGNTGSLDLTHRTRKTRWNIRYSESLTAGRGLQMEAIGELPPELADDLEEGMWITGPDGELWFLDPDGSLSQLSLTDQTYVQERLEGSVRLRHANSRYTWRVFGSRREFQLQEDDEEERYGTALSWRWGLAPRTSTTLTGGWHRTRFQRVEEREDDTWFVRASISRDLQPNVRASLSYRHQQRDARGGQTYDYVENAVTASLFMTF